MVSVRCSVLLSFFLISSVDSAVFYRNNVCPTLRDYRTIFRNKNCKYNPDVGATPELIAKRYGYHLETHPVITKDGYILSLHRVSSKRQFPSNGKKQPIFIVHGLAGVSTFWILQGKRSLAFFLVDKGFDVWLGNVRGNYYSSRHVNLSDASAEFWNFGLEEIAVYDLPASIDFIANRTGEKGNLIYVGHSMGTTVSYIYSILNGKHAEENLKTIVSLAPVAYMKYVTGAFKVAAPLAASFVSIFRSKNLHAFREFEPFQRTLSSVTCGTYPMIILCNSVLAFGGGFAPEEFQPELSPVFFSHYPSGFSFKILLHFSQLITSGRFQMFDYGRERNREMYQDFVPPEYDLGQISLPVHLFVGLYDIVGNLKDAAVLESKLNSRSAKNKSSIYRFPYAHNDFMLAKHLDSFYETLLRVIRA